MRTFLLPIFAALMLASTQAGCASAQLRMPESFPTDADHYAASGISPRRHGQPVRFGPYSALEMHEGDRFGWMIPLGAAALDGLNQHWSYTLIAPGQAPVQSQCRARSRSLRHGDDDNRLEVDVSGMHGPLLACGFRADGEDVLSLQLQRRGDRLEGEASGPDGNYRIRSLHGLQGTPIPSGTPTGYEILRDGRAIVIVDRVNAGGVAMDPALPPARRIELAALATALLLFDPAFGES